MKRTTAPLTSAVSAANSTSLSSVSVLNTLAGVVMASQTILPSSLTLMLQNDGVSSSSPKFSRSNAPQYAALGARNWRWCTSPKRYTCADGASRMPSSPSRRLSLVMPDSSIAPESMPWYIAILTPSTVTSDHSALFSGRTVIRRFIRSKTSSADTPCASPSSWLPRLAYTGQSSDQSRNHCAASYCSVCVGLPIADLYKSPTKKPTSGLLTFIQSSMNCLTRRFDRNPSFIPSFDMAEP